MYRLAWTYQGGIGGNIAPVYSGNSSNPVLIGASDLFTNYGCIIVSLCVRDSSCTTPASAIRPTSAIIVLFAIADHGTNTAGAAVDYAAQLCAAACGLQHHYWNDLGVNSHSPHLDGIKAFGL
ncbi:MAG: hypothetical protein IPH78_15110 [Bacteroidetes bacterium]|nr:hypothetical protein [Bacteroidota bacterium]